MQFVSSRVGHISFPYGNHGDFQVSSCLKLFQLGNMLEEA